MKTATLQIREASVTHPGTVPSLGAEGTVPVVRSGRLEWEPGGEGSQGPQGAQGSAGAQGAQGSAGAQGAQGAQGTAGGGGGGAVGVFASRPAAGTEGAMYFATDGVMAQWVDDGAAWRPMVGGVLGVEVPDLTAFNGDWTAYNTDALLTVSAANGGLIIKGVVNIAVKNRGWYLPVSDSGDISIEVAIDDMTENPGISDYILWGCGIRKSSTGEGYTLSIARHDGLDYSVWYIDVSKWSDDNTRTSAGNTRYAMPNDARGPVFLRVRRSGSNFIADVSRDRQNWTLFDTIAAPFANADQVVIMTEVVGSIADPKPRAMLKSLEVLG